MSTAAATPTPIQGLNQLVDALNRRIFMLRLMRGLAVGTAILLVCLLALGFVDWQWPLTAFTRMLVLFAIAVALVSAAAQFLAHLRRHQVQRAELVALLEQGCPELREQVLAAWEVSSDSEQRTNATAVFVEQELWRQIQPHLGKLSYQRPVSRRRTIVGLSAVGLILSLIAGMALASNLPFGQQVSRLMTPWVEYARRHTALAIENPDRTVLEGSNVSIDASFTNPADADRLRAPMQLEWKTESGQENSLEMIGVEGRVRWSGTIPEVTESLKYRIYGGDFVTNWHTITVVPPPQLEQITLHVQPPAYTELQPRVVEFQAGAVEVFQNSQVRIGLKFDRPMSSVVATVESSDRGERQQTAELADDQLTATFKLQPESKTTLNLELLEPSDLQTQLHEVLLLNVLRDHKPEIEIIQPEQELTVRRDDVVPVTVIAHDDFPIGSLALHVTMGNNPETIVPIETWESLAEGFVGTVNLELSKLDLQDAEIVRYKARVADRRPVPGPQEAFSEEHILLFDDDAAAPGTQQLQQSHQAMKELLDEARERLKQAVEDLEELAEESGDAVDEENRDAAQRLAGEQVQTSLKLDELADRMQQHPLMQAIAEDIRALSEKQIAPSSQQLQDWANQQAQDDPAAKGLDQAQQQTNQAASELDKIDQEFDEIAKLEQDLLELDRLAGQASRLATEAAAAQDGPADEEPGIRPDLEQDISSTAQRLEELVKRHERLKQDVKSALQQDAQQVNSALGNLAEPERQFAGANDNQRDAIEPLLEQIARDLEATAEELAGDPQAQQAVQRARQQLQQGNIEDALQSIREAKQQTQPNADPADNDQTNSPAPDTANTPDNSPDRERRPSTENTDSDPDTAPDDASRLGQAERDLNAIREQVSPKSPANSEPPGQPSTEQPVDPAGRADQPDAGQQLAQALEAQQKLGQRTGEAAEQGQDELTDGQRQAMQRIAEASQQLLERAAAGQSKPAQEAAQNLEAAGQELQQEAQQGGDQNAEREQLLDQLGQLQSELAQDLQRQLDEAEDSAALSRSAQQAIKGLADELTDEQQRIQDKLNALDPEAQDAASDPNSNEPKSNEPSSSTDDPQSPTRQTDERQPDAGAASDPTSSERKPDQSADSTSQPSEASEPKSGEPKSGEPKSGEPKSGEPKSGEPKSGEPKSGEPKSGEPKSGGPKSGEPESGEPSSEARGANNTDQDQQRPGSDPAGDADSRSSTAPQSPAQQPPGEQPRSGAQNAASSEPRAGGSQGNQQAAQQSARAAQRLIEESLQDSQQGNLADAAENAREAARRLQEAAGQGTPSSDATGEGQEENSGGDGNATEPNDAATGQSGDGEDQPGAGRPSGIPQAVGGQLADAMRQLQRALDQIEGAPTRPTPDQAQANRRTSDPGSDPASTGQPTSNQDGQPQPGQQPGQQAGPADDGAPQQGDSADGESGQTSSGTGQPMPADNAAAFDQLASELQQAAQSMSAASKQVQPGQQTSAGGKQAAGGNAAGAPESELSTAKLDELLRQRAGRDWGQLPGTLTTEMLQSGASRDDSDYGELIKQYFERIATLEPPESTKKGEDE